MKHDKIRVGLIDDHNILRQSVAMALSREFDIEVAGSWNNAEDALRDYSPNCCDVYILDLKLPGMSGIKATGQFLKLDPRVKIVVLSAYSDQEDVFKSISAGVRGYLPKDVTIEELVDAIRSVFRGYAHLDPMVTRQVLDRFSSLKSLIPDGEKITPLEAQILSLAATGNTNKEIAGSLDLKDCAVKFHFREIFRKLGAKDRAHAVAVALKQGLIE